MTNYEMIKQSSIKEMAEFLCINCEDCEGCPANNLCFDGYNGMKEWLEKECDQDE